MARGVGGRGPANIMRHLKGVHFPASKRDIVDHVAEKNAQSGYRDTDKVVAYLERLPEHVYQSMADVLQHLKMIELSESEVV